MQLRTFSYPLWATEAYKLAIKLSKHSHIKIICILSSAGRSINIGKGTVNLHWNSKGRFTQHAVPMQLPRRSPCSAYAVPLPCRAAKGLECVFPIWFTQCGRFWFTFAMPCPCHAPTMPFFLKATAQHDRLSTACCAVTLRRTAWSEHGKGMAWQVWIRHGRTV